MSPTLSVVIPSHDTRDLTLACLGSLDRLAGPGTSLEVLVVDDGSADGTAEAIAASHPEVMVVRSDPPAGFTRAANLGLARAHGDLLLLLNSDTEIEEGAAEALLGAFAGEPRLGIAGAALHYPDGSPQWSGGRAPTLPWLFGVASGLPALLGRLPLYRRVKPPGSGLAGGPVDWVTGAALCLRREVWEQAGPLDEGFRFYGQDLDLCLRAAGKGWKIAVVPGFRVLHHHGATIGRVGSAAGTAGSQHPELLYADLLRWARQSRPGSWAGAARLALRAGVRLRLAGRRLALPFLAASRRAAWRRETQAFTAALAALRE